MTYADAHQRVTAQYRREQIDIDTALFLLRALDYFDNGHGGIPA